jgi:hypothetical protein
MAYEGNEKGGGDLVCSNGYPAMVSFFVLSGSLRESNSAVGECSPVELACPWTSKRNNSPLNHTLPKLSPG